MSFNTVAQEEKKEDENQDEEIVPPTGGAKVRPDIRCHNCDKKGHFSSNCPDKTNTNNISFWNFGRENGNFVFLCQEVAADDESTCSMPSLKSRTSTTSSRDESVMI
eukprot:11624049-Ditylum_brightwellii.AAC.1